MNEAKNHFFGELFRLADAGHKERAIDLIFEEFGDRQCRGEFGVCDQMLRRAYEEAARLPPALLVAFLTITLAARRSFPARLDLLMETKRIIIAESGEFAARQVLAGLE
jgi:hypothetical protein